MRRTRALIIFVCSGMVLSACTRSDIGVHSAVFDEGRPIPAEYTCDGPNKAPSLALSNVPKETVSLALLVDDIDAPGKHAFVHWMAWNIPPRTRVIDDGNTGTGSLQGKNSFGRQGYNGPCPDVGPRHRYVFTVYALNTELTKVPQSRTAFKQLLQNHVLAKGTLTATYQISSPRESSAGGQSTSVGVSVDQSGNKAGVKVE